MYFTTERTFSPVYKARASQTRNSSSMKKTGLNFYSFACFTGGVGTRGVFSPLFIYGSHASQQSTMNTMHYRPVFPLFPRESRSVRFDETILVHSVYSMTISYSTSIDLLLNPFVSNELKNTILFYFFFYKKGLYSSTAPRVNSQK